jgi:hypothetical protein
MRFEPVQYTFSKGRHAKIDPFGLQPPYFKDIENMVTRRLGEWRVRTGYETIDSLSSGRALFTLDTDLVAITDTTLESYTTTADNFTEQGAFYNFSTAKRAISIRSAQQSDPVTAAYDGKILTMWEDLTESGDQTIRFKIIGADGETVKEDTILAGSVGIDYSEPRCFAMSNRFAITYKRDSDDHTFFTSILYSDDTSTPASGLDIGIKKNLQGEYTALTNQIAITYIDGANNHRGAFLTNTGFTMSEVTVSLDGPNIDRLWITTRDIASVPESFICYHETGTPAVKFTIRNSAMAQVVAPTAIEAAADLDRPMAIYNDTDWRAYWVDKGGASESTLSKIRTTTISTTGAVGPLSDYLLNRVITSSPIFIGDELYLQSYRYGTFPGYELLTGEVTPTKINEMETVTVPSSASIFNRPAEDNGTFYYAQLSTLSRFRDASFNLLSNVVSYVLSQELKVVGTKAVKSLFLTGPQVTVYDGQDVFEAGFPIPDAIVSEVSAGSTLTVRYAYTFTFTDANGIEIESSPSTDLEVTTNDPSGSNVTIEVRTLKLTRKDLNRVKINLYRTLNLGTTFFLVSQSVNDPAVDTISIVDNVSEVTLATRPVLYTEGDVLENDPIPESTFLKQLNNRIFFIPRDNTSAVGYTKLNQYHASPAGFREIIDQNDDDENKALAELNSNLVIFKSDTIHILTGAGPDNKGQNNDFSRRKVPTDVGCVEPRSIAQLREMVIFKSRRGIYSIDRGENVVYIGAEVEDYNDRDITSAVVYPDYQEARFTLSTGEVLIYNYEMQAWSVFTKYSAAGAVLWQFTNKYYHIRSDGAVLGELKSNSITDFNDEGSAIKIRLRTPWLWFEHKMVRKRAKRCAILGSYSNGCEILVALHTDYVDGIKDVAVVTFDDLVAYSEGNYGEGIYGGGTSLVELRRKLKLQKAKSYSFDISADQLNQDFVFSGMEWEVGMKVGLKDSKAA